ncbi:MAG TPA: PfkB family carbohydrate kinase [Planktothrix sp.]|jgi:fructokinase
MVIAGIGELVVDWIATEKGDHPLTAGLFYRGLGGNCANMTVGVARLGGKARLIAKVGVDIHRDYLFKALKDEGVDSSSIIVDERYPTAQCYCYWNRGVDDYSYYNWPIPHAADKLAADELQPFMFEGVSIIHATGISLMIEPRRSAILRAVDMAKERGIVVSFDACFPTDKEDAMAPAGRKLMQASDILKVNLHELSYWYHTLLKETAGEFGVGEDEKVRQDLLRAAERMLEEYEPSLMVVTLGANGSFLLNRTTHVYCPPFAVKTIAAVGAGDGYIAGLLHKVDDMLDKPSASELQRLHGKALLEIGTFANACGALVTTKIGASDGMPYAADVDDLLKAHSRLP